MSPSGSNQQLPAHGCVPTRAGTVLRAGYNPKPLLSLRSYIRAREIVVAVIKGSQETLG